MDTNGSPFDLNNLSKSDKILAGSGLVFLISTFLSWFTISIAGLGSSSGNGWDVGFLWGRLPFFIVLGMLVWVGLRIVGKATLPNDIALLYLAGGALAFLLPFFKLIIGESHRGLDISRDFGLFLAVLSGAGVAFAGFLKFTEAGGKLDELKAQASTLANQVGDKAKTAIDEAKDNGTKS